MHLFSVLVTDADKGVGLEFVRQFVGKVDPPRHVFATYRSEETSGMLLLIQESAPVQVHLAKLDVLNSEDLKNLKKLVEDTVGHKGLNLLINTGEIAETLLTVPVITAENLTTDFNVNAVGPMLVALEFIPLLKTAASLYEKYVKSFSKAGILNISSEAASIARVGVNPTAETVPSSYRIGKAASHMAMRMIASKVSSDEILVLSMCPGLVITDKEINQYGIEPEKSVRAMLNTMDKLDQHHHGSFLDRLGNTVHW